MVYEVSDNVVISILASAFLLVAVATGYLLGDAHRRREEDQIRDQTIKLLLEAANLNTPEGPQPEPPGKRRPKLHVIDGGARVAVGAAITGAVIRTLRRPAAPAAVLATAAALASAGFVLLPHSAQRQPPPTVFVPLASSVATLPAATPPAALSASDSGSTAQAPGTAPAPGAALPQPASAAPGTAAPRASGRGRLRRLLGRVTGTLPPSPGPSLPSVVLPALSPSPSAPCAPLPLPVLPSCVKIAKTPGN